MSDPRVAVLMATYNGRQWLPDQVRSILTQEGVTLRLIVSDDASTDGTGDWLGEAAQRDERLVLLPPCGRFGSAGANFYRLLQDADLTGADFVAFADQDDIWEVDKLSRGATLCRQSGADAVSSNVTAFWGDGRAQLINKAQPQRRYDHLFEAAGPGCTYLLSVQLVADLVEILRRTDGLALSVVHHDWLCYAVCRALGRRWTIDYESSVRYRQHSANEVGANSGWRAALVRQRKVASGWYRREVSKIVDMALQLQPGNPEIAAIRQRIQSGTLADRIAMSSHVSSFRRSLRDRAALAGLFASGLFWSGQ